MPQRLRSPLRVDKFAAFLSALQNYDGTRADKAVLITSAAKRFREQPTLTLANVSDYFETAHLARPNKSVLYNALKGDRRVSVRQGNLRALGAADKFLDETFLEIVSVTEPKTGALSADISVNLQQTPLIGVDYIADLEKMLELYATLHTLENSMRRLIELVLKRKLGASWWDTAASTPQAKKHSDRLDKEKTRKWLPARSGLGPLYSLDWSDLISLIRKYETDFKSHIGEIEFLHRFADLGLIRHVVAHHGFVDDPKDYERVKIALYDWQKQIGPSL